jgi:hypothetical protein
MEAINAAFEMKHRKGHVGSQRAAIATGVRSIYDHAKEREYVRTQHGPVRVLFKDGKPVPQE